MEIERVTILGAGTMGRGIAEVAAVHGLQVTVIEPSASQRTAAAEQIGASVEKGIRRGKLAVSSAEEVLQRLVWIESMQEAAAAEFVIEAAVEREDIKVELFQQLDEICGSDVILGSNTSSISITRLAAATKRPEQVVGMHFFNPVPVMAPVEIVRGLQTSDATVAATRELAERMGKQAFAVADSPGFAVNRMLMPLINEAVFALQEGVADAATLDSLMKLGCNHPMGPLELADLIGLDVCLFITNVLHRELGDPKYRPCPLLVRMVDAGRLGRKTGEGFFHYDS